MCLKHNSNRLIGPGVGWVGPDVDGVGNKEMMFKLNDRRNQSQQCSIYFESR